MNDVAVSPDGTHTVPAGGYPYEFVELNTSNMQPSGAYPANPIRPGGDDLGPQVVCSPAA